VSTGVILPKSSEKCECCWACITRLAALSNKPLDCGEVDTLRQLSQKLTEDELRCVLATLWTNDQMWANVPSGAENLDLRRSARYCRSRLRVAPSSLGLQHDVLPCATVLVTHVPRRIVPTWTCGGRCRRHCCLFQADSCRHTRCTACGVYGVSGWALARAVVRPCIMSNAGCLTARASLNIHTHSANHCHAQGCPTSALYR
jgi:hypothetical protein